MRVARTGIYFVIAGLDPAIHAAETPRMLRRLLAISMDPRVKPAGDESGRMSR
jgi:hypothetical protein